MATLSNRTPDIHAPRDRASKSNFEMYSWIFMRLSGVLLVVLILGHLFVNLMLGDGVHQIDFAFVAGKWASPVLAGLGPADAVAGATARHQRSAHDHQRLRRARRHPLLAQGAALLRVPDRRRARHLGDLHLRPVPRPQLDAVGLSSKESPHGRDTSQVRRLDRRRRRRRDAGGPGVRRRAPAPPCSPSSTRPDRTPALRRAACAQRWRTSRTTTGSGTPSTPSRAATTSSTRTRPR